METTKITQAFETELNLTEQGFAELIERKKNLVIDVTTEDGFKLARKERAEQNKILKGIDSLAIEGKRSVDEVRVVLKERVSTIYAPNVTAFEAEDIRRKAEAKRLEEEEKARIQKMRDQINSIADFAQALAGKTSDELQSIIEAVDMIDVSENFAELTQEAMHVKKETLSTLGLALSTAIQNEQIAEEKEALRLERLGQEEKIKLAELKAKAQEHLNNLMLTPTNFFGKTSLEINTKIASLKRFEVDQEEFGDLFEDAKKAKLNVIVQLTNMAEQQIKIEQTEADNKAKATPLTTAQDTAKALSEALVEQPSVDKDTSITQQKPKEQTYQNASTDDMKEFLSSPSKKLLTEFCFLFLSNDPENEAIALESIKKSFDCFFQNKAA